MKDQSKPKISVLIYSLGGGGAERVVSILLQGMKDLFDLYLVLMNESISYEVPDTVKIDYLEKSHPGENGIKKLLKIPFLGWKYRKLCRRNRIETSISFMTRPNCINLFNTLFGKKHKTIISVRIASSKEYSTNSFKDRVSRFLIKWLYPKADIIIPNAEAIKLDLKNRFQVDSNIHVIHNPIDIQSITELSRKPVDFDFSRFTFINVARLEPQKNQDMLIRAFGKVEDKQSQLIILGEGYLRGALTHLVRTLNLEKRVFMSGFDNNPYKYMSKSHCFILSSNYEGFPNALVEALACGLPVISTDCQTGPREILSPGSNPSYQLKDNVEFGEYGIMTPVDDENFLARAMNSVVKDPLIQKRYTEYSKQRARDFEKEKIIKQYMHLLEKGK